MAIERISGNLRRTTESNSKPDMPGMFKSEIRISGTCNRISRNAEKPSSAVRVLKPSSASACDNELRIEGSSSTMSNLAAEFGISHLTIHLPREIRHKYPIQEIELLIKCEQGTLRRENRLWLRAWSTKDSRLFGVIVRQLVMQNHVQQRFMNLDAAVVFNQAQFPKSIHEEAHA